MKRKKLTKYLEKNNCHIVREGSKHSLYKNTNTGELSTVSRHSDIKENLCRKICKDLGIPDILKK
ncbi:MAG: type II toxin-antitoxin system HicA family toxin [Bacteroidales bacterium]|nr:type II toxin-antitoxin system HicA family toxin [Bacteroidales bacterium]MCF8352307.1 type II toxin-antitoxin system HicA family toxin [Bacteroidales bacterium]MCF8375406.1 type II toxin-antitoxin system HicA family toxin [Bacteroidales bacterium]MCF8400954.1 type II toxin-antitoxin system HicA family toxin [Bacteroidales bacterium]